MRYLPIDKLNSGMVSACTLQDVYGRILVEKNRRITDSYIEHLRDLGFAGIYVDDLISRGIDVEPTISEEVKKRALYSVQKADPDSCSQVSQSIVRELIQKKRVSMDLMDVRSNSDFTYAHSVNVAVICGIIALGMKLGREMMVEATLTGLLHDIGKMQIDEEILNKPGRLSSEEYMIMKSHAQLSYDYISNRKGVSEDVKSAVLHHHENVDGTGYPDGIPGEEQNMLTKIVHVADVYDALTSKRPYKEPFAPHEAIEYLMGGCGTYFDRKVVEALSLYVPLYPKGTEIKLSDGNSGVIFENSGVHNLRPIVRLFSGRLMDLSSRDNISIAIVEDNVDHTVSILENEKIRKKMADRKMIYVIENEISVIESMNEELKETYEVHSFETGAMALKELKSRRKHPEMVLVNTHLGEESGLDVAREIKKMAKKDIPVLFVSNHADADTIMQVREIGVEGYVLRPYATQYLLNEMERIQGSMLR